MRPPRTTNEPPKTPTLLLTPRDAARELAVSERTLARWSRDGLLPCIKQGRIVRYSRTAIEEWIQDQESKGQHKPSVGVNTIQAETEA